MDPQAFQRLSVGSLGLRVASASSNSARPSCSCEIKLRGFPRQTAQLPLLSAESAPDNHAISSSFNLEDSDIKALMSPGCFSTHRACLEISVFVSTKGYSCSSKMKKQLIGTLKLEIGPEWCQGKPATLFNGWMNIGRIRNENAELHVRVRLDPDPRYVFQFEGGVSSSPQILQLRGSIKQPIFSCKFRRDRLKRRVANVDSLSNYLAITDEVVNLEENRRERKGWKVKIHDLSGSAVAAAFMTTPFVPSTGCDWVAKSNPGAWLIARPDACGGDSWHPWGKLEAWRQRGVRDGVSYRFHLLSDEGEALMSEISLSSEKGGEFFIDSDRQTWTLPAKGACHAIGGFVMSCKVGGDKTVVHLAMRHVTCVEDAAIFVALAAAVDLSIVACRPFRRKPKRESRPSL